MKTLLWLDDLRNPFHIEYKSFVRFYSDYNIQWVKSYYDFVYWIEKNNLPHSISFDHDLGDVEKDQEKTGMDCAKWLVNYCLDHDKKLPYIYIHSANPVGSDNIKQLLNNFKKHF